jgi:dihydrodipicolinate reductase
MKKSRYFLFSLVVFSISALLLLSHFSPANSQSTVQWQSNPPLEQIIPNETLVKLTFQAVDQEKQPLSNANIQVSLLTPPKNPWFSSDFPIVEGTELLNLETIAPQGSLEIEQVFPIRGRYTFKMAVNPQVQGEFEPFEQSVTLNIPESPIKYVNFAILAGILLVVGVAGGWVLGTEQIVREDEIAPQPVRMFLSGMIVLAIVILLYVNISAEFAHNHHHHAQDNFSGSAIANNEEIQIELLGDTQAVVGQLSTQTVQVSNAQTKEARADVLIDIQSIALEHNTVIFAYQGIPDHKGRLTWSEQFFDGAPHKVMATVTPLEKERVNLQPLEISQPVEVEGIAPPILTRLISLFYFSSIFVLGLIGGFWRRRSKKKLINKITEII